MTTGSPPLSGTQPERPLIIQTEALEAEAREWLEAQGARVVRTPLADLTADQRQQAQALIVRTYTQVDAAVLDQLPGLRVVGRAGVALDNIDLEACRARGVEVVHTPGANSSAVAEYVFALLFDVFRPRLYLNSVPQSVLDLSAWEEARAGHLAPRQLCELTLGIYGMGRIGQRVAKIAAAFGMRAIYHDVIDIAASDRSGAEPVSQDELLSRADVVCLHVDDRQGNRHLIGAAAFARMKPDVVFISAARGLLVDTEAAAAFFRQNPAATGLFDVHDPEPFGPEYPLLGLPNIRLLPHIAAATRLAKRSMSWVARDVWAVLAGSAPQHPAPGRSPL